VLMLVTDNDGVSRMIINSCIIVIPELTLESLIH
jgi:hypothetical protein